MTPKEKAKKLVDNHRLILINSETDCSEELLCTLIAKQCALIAVEEIINLEPSSPNDVDWDDVGGTHQYYYEAQREEALQYWQQVKQEIKKL